MRRFALSLALVLATLATSVHADTYVVNPEGTGDFPTIQAAMDAVAGGDIIELTDGTFTGEGNRNLDFLGKAITLRSQSGQPETCVIDCQLAGRGVFFTSGEQPSTVLEGVTIANGGAAFDGGGIHCVGASPTIDECIIQNCRAYYGDGSGMFCVDGSSPELTDCVFIGCTGGGFGGGMSCRESSATLTGCLFQENECQEGAGLACRASTLTVADCSFVENVAAWGGGASCWSGGCATFTDCVFEGNGADGDDWWQGVGGGLRCYSNARPSLIRCTFSDNWAHSGYPEDDRGGAVHCIGDSPSLIECTFFGNSSHAGGGLACSRASSPMIVSCTFALNTAADLGGGISCETTHLDYACYPTVENTIIALSGHGEAFACLGEFCFPILSCCDLFGNDGGDWVGCIAGQFGINGNISEDPLFCDPDAGDFGLTWGSPCAPFSPPNPECDLIGAWDVGCACLIPDDPSMRQLPSELRVTPNPFGLCTRLAYGIPAGAARSSVTLGIYDLTGRRVRTLVDRRRAPGWYTVTWDARDDRGVRVPSGVYFSRLRHGGASQVRRLILID